MLEAAVILESILTCPHCGTAKTETMPTDASGNCALQGRVMWFLPQRPARRRHWLQRFFTMPGEGSQGWTLIARASTSSSAAGRRLDREVWLALAHHRIPKMDAEALAERTIIRNVTRHSRLMAG
jgi:hypothetical protein